ncbi:hypothetical protein HNP33_003734 [Comamonas odontotermitis]|uniref:MarR family transcriptional regulator n=1 Tax=Comamonas odontotermitis TaxID=379895 RepID=A0ABR6RK97_9BURK|nr:hypothetical protein [Comamonas odontotermitis]MBB6579620.1 hypothetical protein [Comamonas odontotermitis]
MNFLKNIWQALFGKKPVAPVPAPVVKQRTKANLSDFVIVNLRVMGRASAAQLADYMAANRRSVANVLGELKAEGKVKPVGKTGQSGNEIVWELA